MSVHTCSYYCERPECIRAQRDELREAIAKHASDMSQERVDETAKDQHEFAEMVKKSTKAWADTPDGWVDDLRGGAEAETPECKTHPDAPHGFDRNASLSEDRYVCECESWEPPPDHLRGATKKVVPSDYPNSHQQEPVAWHEPGAYGNVTTHKDWALANGWEPLYKEKT